MLDHRLPGVHVDPLEWGGGVAGVSLHPGNWAQYFPIPADRGGFDTFEILREDLDSKLRRLLQAPLTSQDTNSTTAVGCRGRGGGAGGT